MTAAIYSLFNLRNFNSMDDFGGTAIMRWREANRLESEILKADREIWGVECHFGFFIFLIRIWFIIILWENSTKIQTMKYRRGRGDRPGKSHKFIRFSSLLDCASSKEKPSSEAFLRDKPTSVRRLRKFLCTSTKGWRRRLSFRMYRSWRLELTVLS